MGADQPDLFSVPFAKGSATSRAAAESMRPCLGEIEARVYRAFQQAGQRGLTTDEAEQVLALPHQTVSARVNGLAKKELLCLTDERRPTRSKRMAGVYRAKETV